MLPLQAHPHRRLVLALCMLLSLFCGTSVGLAFWGGKRAGQMWTSQHHRLRTSSRLTITMIHLNQPTSILTAVTTAIKDVDAVELVDLPVAYSSWCGDHWCLLPLLTGIGKEMQVEHDAVVTYPDDAMLERSWRAFSQGAASSNGLLYADAILCLHPVSICEFYMPLGKPIIMWVNEPFEYGREDNEARAARYFANIRALASVPTNKILTTTQYDAEYIRYMTGASATVVEPWQPSIEPCGPIDATRRENEEILVFGYELAPARGMSQFTLDWFLRPLRTRIQQQGEALDFVHVSARYPNGVSNTQLCRHLAVLHLPSDVRSSGLFEHYQLGIPILVPGVAALAEYHTVLGMLSRRTMALHVHNQLLWRSPSEALNNGSQPYDPNNDVDMVAVHHWLQFSPYHTLPFLLRFDTIEAALDLLGESRLARTRVLMRSHAVAAVKQTVNAWNDILHGIPQVGRVPYQRYPTKIG
jgi:hypothetical protein